MAAEPLSDERLREIEARAAAATKGPWVDDLSGNGQTICPWHDAEGRVIGLQVCVWNEGGTGNHVTAAMTRGLCETDQQAQVEVRQSSADAAFIAAARQDVPDLLAEVRRLREENAGLEAERDRLAGAIRTHRAQKADDRCWLDDDVLYAALGDGAPCDRRVGDKAAMRRNCDRYIENRCEEGGPWVSYAELEAERDRLRAELDDWESAAAQLEQRRARKENPS